MVVVLRVTSSVFLRYAVMLPCVQSSIEIRDPQPSHEQEDDHQREGEGEPGAEVDDVTVWEVAGKSKLRLRQTAAKKLRCFFFKRRRCRNVTFSADQSWWGWGPYRWASPSRRYWTSREYRWGILSTHSAGIPPRIGSPRLTAHRPGAPPPGWWNPW